MRKFVNYLIIFVSYYIYFTKQFFRRYKELLRDGEEDDDELLDEATMADRAWDDWKDNNPRGWGNKMGKRF